MAATIYMQVRLEPEVYRALQRAAKQERRATSAMARVIIEDALGLSAPPRLVVDKPKHRKGK